VSSLQGNVARRVVSGSLWMIGSQALVLGLMFVAQREILSTLSKEDNGVLFFQRRVIDFLMVVFVDLGMNGVLIRRVVLEQNRASEILSSAFALRICMAIGVMILGASISYYSGYSIIDAMLWAVFVFVSARTTLGRYILEVPYRTSGAFRLVSAAGVIDALLFTLGIWLVRENLTPSTVILTYAVAALPGFLLLYVSRSSVQLHLRHVSISEMRALVRESLPVVISVGLIAVHTTLDTMLVELFGTARDVGILGAVNAAIGPFLVVVPQAVVLVFMPEVARRAGDTERRNVSIVAMLRVLVVFATCFAASVVPLLPTFVELVSAGRYSPDINAFTWFLWSAPMAAIILFVQELAVTLGHQRRSVAIASVLVVATGVFGIVWIPQMLSVGAVIARFCTLSVGAFYCVWLLYRFMAKPVDLWVVANVVILIGSSIGVSVFLSTMSIAPWTAVGVTLVCTAGIAFATGLVKTSDVRHLYARMRSNEAQS
jgi:O-antigen/teichoic acid export membrane protein